MKHVQQFDFKPSFDHDRSEIGKISVGKSRRALSPLFIGS